MPTSAAASTSLSMASRPNPKVDLRSAYEAASTMPITARPHQYSWLFKPGVMGSDRPEEPPVNSSQ